MAMAKIWRNRILGKTQFYSACPARYKADVLMLLRQDVENGTVTEDGVFTAEMFEELTGEVY